MAWTNLVERELRYPVVNLGFSGNGKLEPELFSLLDQIDAAVYIIDCLPNIKVSDTLEDKLEAGIRLLREHHSCPILMVDHSGYTNERTNFSRGFTEELNRRHQGLFPLRLWAGGYILPQFLRFSPCSCCCISMPS